MVLVKVGTLVLVLDFWRILWYLGFRTDNDRFLSSEDVPTKKIPQRDKGFFII